jgi:hypothetical protein
MKTTVVVVVVVILSIGTLMESFAIEGQYDSFDVDVD